MRAMPGEAISGKAVRPLDGCTTGRGSADIPPASGSEALSPPYNPQPQPKMDVPTEEGIQGLSTLFPLNRVSWLEACV